jgi:hypothetical protein
MLLSLLLTDTPVKDEVSAFPTAISYAIGVFVVFSLALFAVTRLNPDR